MFEETLYQKTREGLSFGLRGRPWRQGSGTWTHHVGLEQDGVQHDVVLVEQPEDVRVHALRPVGRRLDAVVAGTQRHLCSNVLRV